MPYLNKEYKESNIDYINKDFSSIKNSLINYAKSYFPNTYRDFNETSPGMMLIEMSAYVGDVLSFYIDQQYREMLLPFTEERRNVINIAKMLGYKYKASVPAFVDITFTQNVSSDSTNKSKVDYTNAGLFSEGITLTSTSNSDVIFTTLEPVDFTVSASHDTDTIFDLDDDGLVNRYKLSRNVKAISAETKTREIAIQAPQKFLKIIIPDKNVIEIISVVDSNNNKWYEVEYLAQDRVPISIPYWEDENRVNSENNGDPYISADGSLMAESVSYSLEYITTNKRFIRETNEDGTTSLIFGNGLLKDGSSIDNEFLNLEQLGVIIPGQTTDLSDAINPLLGDDYETLGESPNQTTLTVQYRVGGGLKSNVPAGDLVSFSNSVRDAGAGSISAAYNDLPAVGGKDKESTIEIKERAKSTFSTQNRAVTREDYEARTLNMPSKYGNIAKVYVSRALDTTTGGQIYTDLQAGQTALGNISAELPIAIEGLNNFNPDWTPEEITAAISPIYQSISMVAANINPLSDAIGNIVNSLENTPAGTVSIYILSYDKHKNLIGNPASGDYPSHLNFVPSILKQNLLNYLSEYKLLSDSVQIQDGYIINFGVEFDVVAQSYVNRQQVKLNCIRVVQDYFHIDRMKFGQGIHLSKLEYLLMQVDGVRSINEVKIVQEIKGIPLWRYSIGSDQVLDSGTTGYNYKYDFSHSHSAGSSPGIVLPPHSNNPAVFELKNPKQNILGVVR